jgi:hypothetical protein
LSELNKIINLMVNYTFDDSSNEELGEQDAPAAGGGGGGGAAYPTVTKWETGLTRSFANQIDSKSKWKDLYKITRGKANTLI